MGRMSELEMSNKGHEEILMVMYRNHLKKKCLIDCPYCTEEVLLSPSTSTLKSKHRAIQGEGDEMHDCHPSVPGGGLEADSLTHNQSSTKGVEQEVSV